MIRAFGKLVGSIFWVLFFNTIVLEARLMTKENMGMLYALDFVVMAVAFACAMWGFTFVWAALAEILDRMGREGRRIAAIVLLLTGIVGVPAFVDSAVICWVYAITALLGTYFLGRKLLRRRTICG